MGIIAETFASVFRDYITNGVPASGEHEPEKQYIRPIGAMIEASLGAINLGSVGVTKATRALLDADLAYAANTVGLVYADATGANNDLYIKVGGNGSGSWTLTAIIHDAVGSYVAQYVDPISDDVDALGIRVDSVEDDIAELRSFDVTVGSLPDDDEEQYVLAGTSDFSAAGGTATRIGVSYTVDQLGGAGRVIRALGGRGQAGAGTSAIRVKLWKRPLGSATPDAYPGNASDDVLLGESISTIADLGLAAGGAFGNFEIPIAAQVEAGFRYVATFSGLNGAGACVTGVTTIGWGLFSSGASVAERGWLGFSGDGVETMSGLSSDNAWGRSATTYITVAGRAQQAYDRTASLATDSARLRSFLPDPGTTALRMQGVWCSYDGVDAFNNTTPSTFQTMIETAQEFDAVRIVVINHSAVAVTVAKCKVSTRADSIPTDNNNSATWVDVTFSGSASVIIPARQFEKVPRFMVSDWIPLSSAPRTDGRKGGVAIVRAYVSTPAAISIARCESAEASATRTNGYAWGNRFKTGDHATTVGGFNTTTNSVHSVVAGLEYSARGMVVTLASDGNSVCEGYQDDIRGDSFVVRGARSMNDPDKIAWEAAQLGWTGSESGFFYYRLREFVNAGLHADAMLYSAGTGNDAGGGTGNPLTAAMITTMRGWKALSFALMRDMDCLPIPYTWGPYSAPFFDFDSSDSLRVGDNADTLLLEDRGVVVMDYAAVIGVGSTTVNGQITVSPSKAPDGVHPNAATYDECNALQTVPKLRAALGLS